MSQKCEIHFRPPKPPKLTFWPKLPPKFRPAGRGSTPSVSMDQSFSSVLAHFKIRPPRSATPMPSHMVSPRSARALPLRQVPEPPKYHCPNSTNRTILTTPGNARGHRSAKVTRTTGPTGPNDWMHLALASLQKLEVKSRY